MVNPDICTAWIYNYVLIMMIYRQVRFLDSRLGVLVLDRDYMEDVDAWEVWERLILLYEFD